MKIKLTRNHAEIIETFFGVQGLEHCREIIERGGIYDEHDEEMETIRWIDNNIYNFYKTISDIVENLEVQEIEFEIDKSVRKALNIILGSLTMTTIRYIINDTRLEEYSAEQIYEATNNLYFQVREDKPETFQEEEVAYKPQEILSMIINKELSDDDRIVFPYKEFVYNNGKIQDEVAEDLTIEQLSKVSEIIVKSMDYVTFEDAMKSGKKIKYNHKKAYLKGFYNINEVLNFLVNSNIEEVVREILSSKCWIIEE